MIEGSQTRTAQSPFYGEVCLQAQSGENDFELEFKVGEGSWTMVGEFLV